MSEIEKLYELTTNCSQLTDKEIINADGTRNWQANILLDNVKRLEAENKLLKGTLKDKNFVAIVENNEKLEAENAKLKEENYCLNNELLGYKKGVIASENIQLKQTLQEIKSIAQNLYYQSIKDPVKREAATYEIIEKINGI